MGNVPLGHEMCGHVLNLDLSARVAVLDQEGQRTLKLEEQITQSFDEGADLSEQIELDRDLPSPRSSSRKCLVIVRGIVPTWRRLARDMVATIILPSPSAEVPGPSNNVDSPTPTLTPVSDWRYNVSEIFPEVQEVNENIAALLVESGRSTPKEQTLVRDLQLTLRKLHAQLRELYQHLSGPFLRGL